MSGPVIVTLGFMAACVLMVAVQAWRDVRVARWTGADPRAGRKARCGDQAAAQQAGHIGGTAS